MNTQQKYSCEINVCKIEQSKQILFTTLLSLIVKRCQGFLH